jgi:LPPG:FO 2-phospho-L-lactate transferase
MIGLNAFKGPTAKIMRELGYEMSSFTVASYYSSNTIDGIIIDSTDSALITRIEDLGIKTLTTDIAMHSLEDKVRLANQAIEFAESLG